VPPSIKQVALQAGVSTATVSRLLNKPESVSSDTAGKINEAIAALGFISEPRATELAQEANVRILTLKRRNQQWGLRELEDVTRTAALHGLQRQQVVRMPANNLTVVFAKTL